MRSTCVAFTASTRTTNTTASSRHTGPRRCALRSTRSRTIRSNNSRGSGASGGLAGIAAVTGTAAAHPGERHQGKSDDQERHAGCHAAERIEHWRRHVSGHAIDLERQGVEVACGIEATRVFIIREGETEQPDADQAWCDDGYDDVAHSLPGRGAKIACRFLVTTVEAVEDRKHDQKPERQRPGEMSSEGRRIPPGIEIQ